VRRVVAFVFHNWPLKLAAILLATLLYAGLIVSASAETFPGRIPIQVLNQPGNAFIIGNLDDVTSIRYLAVGANRQPVIAASFTATIDLAGLPVVAGSPPVSVPVTVRATDPGSIQVIDFSPSRIQVRLDPLTSKVVPVQVDRGTVPEGLDVREPVVSQDTVTVSGQESSVVLVTAAEARVRIQPSGIDINQVVDLLAVDARGDVVPTVELLPSSVRVTIQIGSQLATRALPVNPVVSGSPNAGAVVTDIAAAPLLVTVEAESAVLARLVKIDTKPVSIAGATGDVVADVPLDLPPGISALGVSTVRVTVSIRPQLATRTFQTGVGLLNADPTTGYDLGVDQVAVIVGGPLAALNALDGAALVAHIDVGGLSPGVHAVPVVVQVPAGLTVVGVTPPDVTVTVTPPPSPSPPPPPPLSPSPSLGP
jgi:YbbR domain-containing protein